MPRLPVVSDAETVRAFTRLGWRIVRRRGSHIVLTRPGALASLSVPNHKELDRGTLHDLIREAEIAVDAFVAALRR
jgi:predicted RNA binding protein YcfA (HicA-like mRNA interferase family)